MGSIFFHWEMLTVLIERVMALSKLPPGQAEEKGRNKTEVKKKIKKKEIRKKRH